MSPDSNGSNGSMKLNAEDVLALHSALTVRRSSIANRAGSQYNGDRDLYDEFGYNNSPTFDDYLSRYHRQGIAQTIVDAPARTSWRGGIDVVDQEDGETAFENELKKTDDEIKLLSTMSRADRLAGVGQYGVILIGYEGNTDFSQPVNPNADNQIEYLEVYKQGDVRIKNYVTDKFDRRYGQPNEYEIDLASQASSIDNDSTADVGIGTEVHWSRVIHVPSDPVMEDEIFGTPRMEKVLNRLYDLEKVIGSSAEIWWRNADPGKQINIDDDYELSQDMIDDLEDQLEEYDHSLRRWIRTQGADIQQLTSQIEDPSPTFETIISDISASTNIPKRRLTGNETGERASEQDERIWHGHISERREDHVEPYIIRPTLDRLIEHGVLPEPSNDGYKIEWPGLREMSEQDKADVAKTKAEALQAVAPGGEATMLLSEEDLIEKILGIDPSSLSTDQQEELANELDREDAGIEDML